ncbi:hypothetical protein [Prochlorococcus marinus]|uniref:hypothetical protein n=1 Tax=Prochlorococcus marinus TaxID=1219 RepID=UPI0022B54DFA|nr:hypothetical protein [Prochlorococcus marinus]
MIQSLSDLIGYLCSGSDEYNDATCKRIKEIRIDWSRKFKRMRLRTNNSGNISIIRKMKILIIAFLGLFIHSNRNLFNKKYIFQGLRNSSYFDAFPSNQICILIEREKQGLCNTNGFIHTSRFPDICTVSMLAEVFAVQAYQYLNIDFFLKFHIYRWSKSLMNQERKIFIWEDTQPMGTFLSCLSLLNIPSLRVICIQHGLIEMASTTLKIPPTGSYTINNMVWNNQQGKQLQQFNPKINYSSIGLSYYASAYKNSQLKKIYLIGSGWCGNSVDQFDYFPRIIKLYSLISLSLEKYPALNLFYRPHPNESKTPQLKNSLNSLGKKAIVDISSKLELLNQERCIFFGLNSSLLYEAKLAGHYIVFIQSNSINSFSNNSSFPKSNSLPFNYDETLVLSEIANIDLKIATILKRFESEHIDENIYYHDPIKSFKSSLNDF